eukprot:7183672-Pyramimonas_sp.AAC.2
MAITHDPGPAGPSGEGETLIVSLCLMVIVATLHVFRVRIRAALGWVEEVDTTEKVDEENIKANPTYAKDVAEDIETNRDGGEQTETDELSARDKQVTA